MENLKLFLRPYEILSIGPDCGIVEMVKNSVTLDSLKRYLCENQETFNGGINNFFSTFYGENAM